MKNESGLSGILVGVLYFVLGVVFLAATENLFTTFNYVLVCICAIIGVIQLIQFFTSKKYENGSYTDLLLAVVFIWVSLVLFDYYRAVINILPILFSLYLFVMACDMLVRHIQSKKDNVDIKGIKAKKYLILSVLALIIGLLLIFNPGESMYVEIIYVYLKITGVYLIIVSMLLFMDLFKNFKKEKQS